MPSAPDPESLEEAIRLAQAGELEAAERLLLALLRQTPDLARGHNALGVVQMQQGKSEEAEKSLLRAATAAPDDSRVHLNLGKLYSAAHRDADAEQHLREAVRLAPDSADACFSLGVFLKRSGRVDEAEACIGRALRLAPDDAGARYALARLQLETGRFALAEASYREAIRLQPEFAVAHSDLAMILLETGRLQEAQDACRTALSAAPEFQRGWSNYVMCGQYDPQLSDAELLARAQQAGETLSSAASRFSSAAALPAVAAPILHIGFVSGDLHRHPVGLLLLPVLRELKALGLRITLYSSESVVDEVAESLGKLANWVDISDQADEQAWTRIRHDRPDVLVDLAGHTGKNRLAIFAARAAPLQLSWLGYFATTGTPNMDCVLMDPWHAPAGCESQFTERMLRMPHTRFCFQPIEAAPAAAQLPPAAASGQITFGSFNNIAKVNEQVIRAWSRVLQGTPRSRLVLKWRTLSVASCRSELAARFLRAGIGAERLEFRPESRHEAMLGEYADIDIALDTFPFTGGQTSFEAAWMGVPIVTLAGARPVSRQTLAVLGNLGLQDLAAHTADDFVECAVALARDLPRVRDLRVTLRQRMRASPLMQAPEFARAFVTLLRDAAGSV